MTINNLKYYIYNNSDFRLMTIKSKLVPVAAGPTAISSKRQGSFLFSLERCFERNEVDHLNSVELKQIIQHLLTTNNTEDLLINNKLSFTVQY